MPLTTDDRWVELVKTVKANNPPDWGAGRIAREVAIEGKRLGLSDPPHERTIGRILRREWDTLMKEQQAQYRYFNWPESMERGDLPWEASASALELIRVLFSQKKRFVLPSVRLARWFWRVTQAAPEANASIRKVLALGLTEEEERGRPHPSDYYSMRLALSPFDEGEEIGVFKEHNEPLAIEMPFETARVLSSRIGDLPLIHAVARKGN